MKPRQHSPGHSLKRLGHEVTPEVRWGGQAGSGGGGDGGVYVWRLAPSLQHKHTHIYTHGVMSGLLSEGQVRSGQVGQTPFGRESLMGKFEDCRFLQTVRQN